MRPQHLLTFLILIHVGLAGWYNAVTPYRTPGILLSQRDPETGGPARALDIGAPDERQHVNYVAHVYQGRGLPVFRPTPEDPGLYETYQFHQPPLYYYLAAGWMRVLGARTTDLTHPADGARLRAFNHLVGAATVAGVFFLGFWGYRRADVALAGAVIAALLPMHVALSGAVSNDPLLFCLCTWVLAAVVRGLQQGWTQSLGLWVGLLTGLALVTKTTAIALLPTLLATVMLKEGAARPDRRVLLTTVGLTLLPAIPWWVRNIRLYGDPFTLGAFQEAFVGTAQARVFIEGFGALGYWVDWVGWWTARSFFGVFGYMDIFLNEAGTPRTGPGAPNTLYRILIVLALVLSAAWLDTLRRDRWASVRSSQFVNGLFLVVVLGLFLRFNGQYFQGQARYLFPAIGPIAVFMGVGLLHLAHKWRTPATSAVAAALLSLNLYALDRLPGEFDRRTEAGYRSVLHERNSQAS
jgi:4-amino-4-deoxy-L-arabinose transferase-like glycosyltransferase